MAKRQITKIEAARPTARNLRVAAYCRVSTTNEDQLTSIENQLEHYSAQIKNHEGWELAGIYVEEGVSGTKKEIRPELNRMLDDCRAGEIDLILTKSISRFSRNVTDCLDMVHTLTDLGIRIIFEKENLDTGDRSNDFILSILSTLAEEESHSISDNMKWSIQKRMQDGIYHQSKAPYGYRWSNGSNGDMIPDPLEAAIVRWMYDKVLEGKGTSRIARELNEAGIPSPQNSVWCGSTVRAILKNPANIGDVMMNKSYKDRNFKSHLNLGEKPLYYQEAHHEGLVNKETFDLANAAMVQRGKEKGNGPQPPEMRVKHRDPHTNRYAFSGKLVCGECGAKLVRRTQYTKKGKRYHWACATHEQGKDLCQMKKVLEDNIQNAFVTMIKKLQYASFLLDDYCEEVLARERREHRERLTQINEGLKQNTESRHRLTLLLQSGCIEPVSFNQEWIKLENTATSLKEERNKVMHAKDNPVVEFRSFVRSFKGETFPDEEFPNLVEKVIIHSQMKYTFVLACGLRLTEDITAAEDMAMTTDLTMAMTEEKEAV